MLTDYPQIHRLCYSIQMCLHACGKGRGETTGRSFPSPRVTEPCEPIFLGFSPKKKCLAWLNVRCRKATACGLSPFYARLMYSRERKATTTLSGVERRETLGTNLKEPDFDTDLDNLCRNLKDMYGNITRFIFKSEYWVECTYI